MTAAAIAGGIVTAIAWILCLIGNIRLAKRFNRSVGGWVVLSIFFSSIALGVHAILGPKKD